MSSRRCSKNGPSWPRHPIPDLVGLGRVHDRFDGTVDQIVIQNDFDLHLGQEIHHIFGTAIEFGMAFLTSEPLDLDHAQALNTHVLKRLFHFIQLERLDDCLVYTYDALDEEDSVDDGGRRVRGKNLIKTGLPVRRPVFAFFS